MKRTIFWALLLIAAGCSSPKNTRTADPLRVTTIVAAPSAGFGAAVYVGSVEEEASASLSFPVAGTVARTLADEGQRVRKGQLLAELDSTSARQTFDAARASLEQAEDACGRLRQLYEAQSLPEIKWVEAQTRLRQAESLFEIAKKNHVEMHDCYTGFKWIAREIRINEGKKQYIGGGEESYGFMAEDFVRDKDAVSACSLLAEICAWAKDQGKTLFDILMDIYVEYGFSLNNTINVVKPGKSGADEIKAMMTKFRTEGIKEIAGSKVVCTKDYADLTATDAEGNKTKLDFPEPSNVLQWFTEDGIKVSVRPSGTEPKIKFYIEVMGKMGCPKCYESARAEAAEKVEAVKKSLGL